MSRIDTPPTPSAVAPLAAAQSVVPLAQRAREQAADALPGEEDPAPLPEPEDPVVAWAKQIFKEKMFFGEEEENGIPPLSIEF